MSISQYQLKLERAEAIIRYRPQKPQDYYLWEALQVAGSGHTRIAGRSAYDGNKRLAIVGDTAMALALARPWYKKDETLGLTYCRHCNLTSLTAKGDWDAQRQQLLSNNNLARVARESGLVDCMIVNPRNPVQASTKLAANLVEAIVGAVWFDSDENIDAVREVMEALHLTTLVSLMLLPHT